MARLGLSTEQAPRKDFGQEGRQILLVSRRGKAFNFWQYKPSNPCRSADRYPV